jgi:hypothetical protein
MLATLKEYAESLRPKVVLWFYFEGNDLKDLSNERRSPLLSRYLEPNEFSQRLSSRQDEIDRALGGYLDTVANKSELLAKLEEASAVITDAIAKCIAKHREVEPAATTARAYVWHDE